MSDTVTAEEARDIAQRFIRGHFGDEPGPRISIPANPGRDDDLRLVAFIERAARIEAAAVAVADSFGGCDHGAEIDALNDALTSEPSR